MTYPNPTLTGGPNYVWSVRADHKDNTLYFDTLMDRVTLDPAKLSSDPAHAVKLERRIVDNQFEAPVYLEVEHTSKDGIDSYTLRGANFDLNANGNMDANPTISTAVGTEHYAFSTYPDDMQDSQWMFVDCMLCHSSAVAHASNATQFVADHTRDGVFDANADGLGDTLTTYVFDRVDGNPDKGMVPVDYSTRQLFITAQKQ